jgi:amino acid adenylation domain-containing protein
MLQDANAPLLLSLSNLSAQLPDFAGERVCLDRDWAQIEQESAQNPETACTAENLAYVIYTSGSTGTPKGVEIQHRAIVRLVRNTDYYHVDASDRILQASNISFDAATFELWGALLNGACMVGIDKDRFVNSKALAAFLRKNEITTMFVTTAVFNQVAREAPGIFSGLRALLFGGEAADCGAVREVLAHHPPERLLHVYGPTESTTFASWYQVEAVAADATTVPIGRPLANTTLYVLDKQMQSVPVGIPGELYIGGDGLARGYLNRPELTAEKFIPNPFSNEPGARLYRTGDKVRYRIDGAIEFQGRFDNQVKMRGFRIELGEIETALRSHKGVSDAVVTLQQGASSESQLVAHVVVAGDWQQHASRQIPDLREYLAQTLPDFMVPAAFVTIDALPLTPNAKVDRKALLQPVIDRFQLPSDYEKPRDDVEEKLAVIWADVLGLERVGINDQFLDLGGQSLLATRIVTRVREVLGVGLSLAEFYKELTVKGLAMHIKNTGPSGISEELTVISPAARDEPLPVSFPQEQVIFLTQLSPESLAYNTQMSIRRQTNGDVTPLSFGQQGMWFLQQLDPASPVYNTYRTWRVRGALNVAALKKAFETIVARQEVLRAVIEVVGGKACQLMGAIPAAARITGGYF